MAAFGNFIRLLVVVLLFMGLGPSTVNAHPLAPSLLEINKVTDTQYNILWKTPRKKEKGVNLVPRLPDNCGKPIDPKTDATESAYLIEYSVECAQPIQGQEVHIEDLAFATTNVVVRFVDERGNKTHWLLSNEKTAIEIPLVKASSSVFGDYLVLGVEHLIGGIDHVLFVIALLLLVPLGMTLVWAITAFTLGHSITLALSALDLLAIPQQPIEILIAVTIMLVASDVISSPRKGQTFLQRYPGAMTCLFGLIHGLGFAGVLGDIGLPVDDKVLALFAFNVGLEVGQLGVVLLWIVVAKLLAKLVSSIQGQGELSPWLGYPRWQLVMAYGIGSIGAYWVYDRSFMLLGIGA